MAVDCTENAGRKKLQPTAIHLPYYRLVASDASLSEYIIWTVLVTKFLLSHTVTILEVGSL